MIHFCQHIDRVGVKWKVRISDHAQRIQLVTKCSLAIYELRGIRAIQTIYAVRTTYAIL